MINKSKAKFFLSLPSMPKNSLINFKFTHDVIVENLDKTSFFDSELLAKIRKVFIGKTAKNLIEKEVDFSCDKSIINHFKDLIECIEIAEVDINSDAAKVELSSSIFFANRDQLTEVFENITSMEIESFFIRINFND